LKKSIAIAGIALLMVGLTGCAGKFELFQKAYETCGSPAGIRVSDEGKSITIDGYGEDDYSGADLTFGDNIDVSWSYHPDNGLDIVIHKN